jgi:multiple sugar transport system substrate-binding protein
MRTPRNAALAIGAVTATIALGLTGCSSPQGADNGPAQAVTQSEIDTAMQTPTTLTYWTWVPDIQNQVDLFEQKYPEIQVDVVNLGGATDQYPKLRAALQAGKGVPDVAQVGYDYLPSFTQTKSLLDLVPYGADDLRSEFVPGIWSQVVQNNGVYGVPQDSGPMGTLYRTDLFEAAGVSAPGTWDEFAAGARSVKEKTGAYITNLPGNDPAQMLGLFQQAGAKMFGYDGDKTVTINVDSPETQRVARYWQDLIDQDLVATDADFNDNWYQGLSRGSYATWLTAAWGPTFLSGSAAGTSGKWTAATLPQWEEGENVSGNWGGSSNAVMAPTEYPIAAYELAKFINTDAESTLRLANEQSLFPTTMNTLSDPEFADAASEFFGGQQVNKFFADVSATVPDDTSYVPFQDYVVSSYNSTFGQAIADHSDLEAALTAWQQQLESYATQQGFTVE